MIDLPLMYVIACDGDTSDADYTGVSKSLTATGSQYRIVGPLAEALGRAIAEAQERGAAREREECVKVAEGRASVYAQAAISYDGTPIGESATMRCGAATAIADAIRKRGEA